VSGYIKNNFLNIKRLMHITGVSAQQGYRIKQIEISKDPCPVKLGKREVEKVMSTSKAQSIVSSRMSSRKTSRRDSMEEDEEFTKKVSELKPEAKPRTKDGKIINKLGNGEEQDSN
jgi:predicted DNA-binding transcriptional regulator AlpA